MLFNRNKFLSPCRISLILLTTTHQVITQTDANNFSSAITSKESSNLGYATLIAQYSMGNESKLESSQIQSSLKKLRMFIKNNDSTSFSDIDLSYIDKNLPKSPTSSKDKYQELSLQLEYYLFWHDFSKSSIYQALSSNSKLSSQNYGFANEYKNAAQTSIINCLKEIISQEKQIFDPTKVFSIFDQATEKAQDHVALSDSIIKTMQAWLKEQASDPKFSQRASNWMLSQSSKIPTWHSFFKKAKEMLSNKTPLT